MAYFKSVCTRHFTGASFDIVYTFFNRLNIENIINQQTLLQYQVSGLEVNSTWWESEHSTPHYIPLEYISPVPSSENDSDQRDWRNIQEVYTQ